MLLVGYAGKLFIVEDDYQVSEVGDGYAAIGSGDNVAKGALYLAKVISKNLETDKAEDVELALKAAEHHNATVRRPFVIKKL